MLRSMWQTVIGNRWVVADRSAETLQGILDRAFVGKSVLCERVQWSVSKHRCSSAGVDVYLGGKQLPHTCCLCHTESRTASL